MKMTLLSVLTQWAIFLVALSTILVPAVVFRRIAKRNNKKGWLYFLAGLGVGWFCLALSRFFGFLLVGGTAAPASAGYVQGLTVFFLVPAIVVALVVLIFKRGVVKGGW